ncbi:GH92 family glycosyl hydrolase [Actinospica sp. MGRD01-02]|uniref:GH92 family glycosyl hydrolase n=1 Tax=Actinospica acidithermotolerans TaxID=2828514 RepID=A0A941IH99_9ACTN|nr:GH92 family glycosyl hydrolase [Actinospica acidithermotolerans]MBR7825492.1 GH92 family glycosyl hydrolase [Actinospica acidithermotolerans]
MADRLRPLARRAAGKGLRFLTAGALATLAVSAAAPTPAHAATLVTSPDSLVNTFVGTGSNADYSAGNTFPGADVPHGMVQWSPDTSSRPNGGGYDYADSDITGFSLTHVSGVGCEAAGDVPILPITGAVGSSPGSDDESFSHSNETASPGYYSVALGNGTSVALTTSTHAGIGQFTFPASTSASLLLKLDSPDTPYVSSTLSTVGSAELTGSVTSSGFCEATNDFTVYFAIEFGTNFTAEGTYGSTSAGPGGAYVTFGTPSSALTVTARVGVSYTSAAEAQANLDAEVAGKTFAQVEASAQASWTAALDKIEIAGGTSAEQATFYTALYHSELYPSVVSDADGSYRGYDGGVHTVASGHSDEYADFSNWDTYRSQAQLTALINPAAASDMAQSIVDDYTQGGTLTKWGMNNGETYIMVGDSGVPVLADYYAFGATGFDTATALSAMEKEQTTDTDVTPGVTYLDSFGYLPTNSIYGCCHEYATVSTQLEYDIDDFALSAFAGRLGDTAVQARFQNRAQDWENIYNSSSGYIQPRHSNGRWMDGFDAKLITSTSSNDFAEGDAFTYTPDIPFNIAGLASLEGGDSSMAGYLDSVLSGYQGLASVAGTQANLGNEPSIEIPYEYDWVGEPYKTQGNVRAIEDELWSDSSGGIPGNDDLGEMSSWYVWSALGLYPETPGTSDLAIGSPLFTEAVVSAGSGGKTLTISAANAADADPYVQGLTINGTSSSLAYLPAADLESGTTLNFTLGSSAETSWASASADAPPSYGGTAGTGVAEPTGAITETDTGKCVDDAGAGTSNGTAIQIYTCNGTNAQTWTVAPDNTLQVMTDCMDVTGGATTAGTAIQLHTCNGTAAEQWDRNSAGELVNPASGLCLTDNSNGATNKTQLELETCAATEGQIWTLP